MRKINTQGNTLVIVLVALLVIGGLWYITSGKSRVLRPAISGFTQCASLGYPVSEKYPRECRTPDGKVYREGRSDLSATAMLAQPYYNAPTYTTPSYMMPPGLTASDFYVRYPIARSSNSNYSTSGTRVAPVVSRDSSSNVSYYGGGSTYYTEQQVSTGGSQPSTGRCFVGGCSGQICSDRPDAMSTCEYRPEYACYQQAARCERQASGQCGWTLTSAFHSCVANSSGSTTIEYYQ